MKLTSQYVRLSATDISNHLACRDSTNFNLAVALGQRTAPEVRVPDLWVLQELGLRHEKAYLDSLASTGLTVLNLGDMGNEDQAQTATLRAMNEGTDVIAQAVLSNGRWFGRADVLRRTESASALGAWSYEIHDCKLASETRAATILQLSLYSEILGTIQGLEPRWMHVVLPSVDFIPERFRVLDFAAYYRYVKKHLEEVAISGVDPLSTYPEPNPNCPICRWEQECKDLWRKDDHLSLVAGISKLQRKQLKAWQTETVELLAQLPLPLQQRPDNGSKDGYVRVREQARMQVAGRTEQCPVYELLDVIETRGLTRLPQLSAGDVFFDLEGDPFAVSGGREYLFGFVAQDPNGIPAYDYRWGTSPELEKQAFEWFVDSMMIRWEKHPAMHIFHFTPYEPSALKRLMGRYATREDQIDRMLRAGLFIDLHVVVKQAVRASVEQYSLKTLEIFHDFKRIVPLAESRQAMRAMEHSLELTNVAESDETIRKTIAGYNADDCLSTRSLRDWLEEQRLKLEQAGIAISRPIIADGAPPDSVNERQQRVMELVLKLTNDVPADARNRTEEQAARWLLANLLDWHRREDKADFWDFFRLKDLADEDLLDEKSAIAGLVFDERVDVQRKIPIDRYRYEKQEADIRPGKTVCNRDEKIGEVVVINIADRTIDIKKTRKTADLHPTSIFVDCRGPLSDTLTEALFRLGLWVSSNGIDAPGPHRAARDLLLRRSPRLIEGSAGLVMPGESTTDAAKRIAPALDDTVLAIQGPPGAGKTYSGARMICELVRQGRRVGITAGSHKVIRNLLDEVLVAAREEGLSGLACLQKLSDKLEEDLPAGLTVTTSNSEAREALQSGSAQVVAGTSWLWSREDFLESVDVLFVDEAGQMSLANVLSVAQAARNLVLLGDPQQLEQPLRGSHPEGAEISALEHLLAGSKTIAPDKGLFLEKTWRLHPKICQFTSEVFYEGRLQSRQGLENQQIEGHTRFKEAGLWFVPVDHEGNRNSSSEEVEEVAAIVESFLEQVTTWVDAKGNRHRLRLDDILIVAPYNAQVSDLANRLKRARVGTVDKFQGQEAPIVIYSMTTSSPEEAPRGMEFLYSLNRLNVATSRARAMAIIVGSPLLLQPECRSPRQMQLANALCRYVELSDGFARAMPVMVSM